MRMIELHNQGRAVRGGCDTPTFTSLVGKTRIMSVFGKAKYRRLIDRFNRRY